MPEMETPPVDPSSTSPPTKGTKKEKTKPRMSKASYERSKFQLFDPTVKGEVSKLCEGGLVHLILENEGPGEEDNSLDFEASSEDEGIENLPDDRAERKSRKIGKEPEKGSSGKGDAQVRLFCTTCKVGFIDTSEQRQHYTLDWHRYNIKRKLNEQDNVSELKFSEMMDDLSSIDGSDEEEEENPNPSGVQAADRLIERIQNTPGQPTQPAAQTEVVKLSRNQKLEKSPKIFFKNEKGQILSCFKAIVPSAVPKQVGSSQKDTSKSVKDFTNCMATPLKITIIMASGGHFAAAVFEGNTCTNHKTFHSYTVRAKQGGSQGTRDAKSGGGSHPKSAGASLRRYNEQSFSQHVQELTVAWKKSIDESNLIFYRAVSSNANFLFGGKSPPLTRDNPKLRTIPFPTKRPTFNEVKRVHSFLTTIHVYESMDSFLAAHSHFVKNPNKNKIGQPSPSKSKSKNIDRARSRSPKRKDDLDLLRELEYSGSDENEDIGPLEEVNQIVDFSELKEYDDSLTPEERTRKKKSRKQKSQKTLKLEGVVGSIVEAISKEEFDTLPSLICGLSLNNTDANDPLDVNQSVDLELSTLLHLASKRNLPRIVWSLMEVGCDPAIKDKSGKYPYNYATSRECRETFRRFMGQYPEKYDYNKAQVPPPLSDEMEKERAERKKLLNKMKREKEKQKKMERKEHEKETEEQRRFLNLSDREKRALAAEQRILAQCKKNAEKAPVFVRCFECAMDITGKDI